MSIGREINEFIADAEQYGKAAGIKKPTLWEDESGKMHKFVKGEVRGGNIPPEKEERDLPKTNAVARRIADLLKEHTVLAEMNPKATEAEREAQARKNAILQTGRNEILQTFQHFGRQEISQLRSLIGNKTITESDIKTAIYYTNDKTKKVALAQAFLTARNPEKWDNEIKALRAMHAQSIEKGNKLKQPSSEQIQKSLTASLSKIKALTNPHQIKEFVESLIKIQTSTRSREEMKARKEEAIKKFENANGIGNLGSAVEKAFDQDLKARAHALSESLSVYNIEGLNLDLTSLKQAVQERMEGGEPPVGLSKIPDFWYEEATRLINELSDSQVQIEKDAAIESFRAKTGLTYSTAVDLVNEFKERNR